MQNNFDFNRGAVNPIQCLSDGYELLKGNYGKFLGILIIGYLIIIVCSFIPLTPLMPPIICGFYLCLFAMIRHEHFSSSTLFKGFDFFGQSFLASLFVTVPMFILSFLLQIGIYIFAAYVETLNLSENTPVEEVLPILYGFLGLISGSLILFIVVAFILGFLMAFIYPLIVDRRLNAFQAIKLSIRGVFGNFFGVLGLMILGQLILLAGLMFFYIGALFVAPIIIAAWAVAYSRIFHQQIVNPVNQMNYPQQVPISAPHSASKAGWVLTLSSLLILGVGITTITVGGIYTYSAISSAIAKKAEEDRQKRENSDSKILFPETEKTETPSTKDKNVKRISGGILNGSAVYLPKPKYPAAAKAVNAKGAISVSVIVDKSGNVISAKAVSGHPLLRNSAETAARKAKFRPRKVGDNLVEVSGMIVYNFVATNN